MGEASSWQHWLGRLRRWPGAYHGLRNLKRGLRQIPIDLLRRLAPLESRFGCGKGVFSAYDELLAGRVEGRILLPAQDIPPPPPDGLQIRAGLNQAGHQPWPIFWTRHQKIRLVGPNLIPLDREKRACNEAMYCVGPGFHRDQNYSYAVLPPAERLTGPWTSLVAAFGAHFYHWFLDELPRLWPLPEFPPDTRILVPGPLPGYARRTLEWLGLADRAVETTSQHLWVEDFYFSTPTVRLGCANPFGLQFLRERFLPFAARSAPPPRRVYLIRSGKTRGIANETEVRAFFERRGWALIDPETLDLARQIQLFAGAEALCGLHGGAFTNLAWCSPGCRVVELLGPHFLNGGYEAMAAPLGLQHRFLISPDDAHLRVQVDLPQLDRLLREMDL